ncbi:Putative phosphoribosyl transferasec/MT0597 [Thalassovita gelatinovora]|uniref:Putative phosphoribosyl transferasec/MT0597 n=1 Tax=Thalassovita gelatinovora TaxID=53501 RepID=A0A0P1F7J3_THAGE|nr:phosphoribosyltransferase [Thalassovita gelatinovora]CUH63869.1 Putative phosphoribosyl transferasec/MT0597 [Thalassovita gelatinovora]SEQ96388.1 putative phosphoribosyl transferase [Thalassovita gelatinovora]
MMRFADRQTAGQALAEVVAQKAYADPVILALPRGGVPVAIELVRALHAPMDLVMVRKIGAPGQPELAVAAVVNGDDPQIVINDSITRAFGLNAADIEAMSKPRLQEIARRRALYLGDRKPVPVKGRTAIVTDDGIATGATMRASLLAVRRRDPARLVLAVPVASREVIADLGKEVDEVICLTMPDPLRAIGLHYDDFSQVDDDEVVRLLAEADRLAGPPPPEG